MRMESMFDKISPLSPTAEEIDTANAMIANGELDRDYWSRRAEVTAKFVFGNEERRELGMGSANNQTRQSVEAYRLRCNDEPNYLKNLARMEKELAECEARRAATRKAAGK